MTDCENATVKGISIPVSAARRTYSVSLHDNIFDVSELPITTGSNRGNDADQPDSKSSLNCPSCGQVLPPKKASRDSANVGSVPTYQLSQSLPLQSGFETR